ncbi:MAG: L-threonylcarbamoyladenylate synthase [Prochlorococcaceae cyanobacterium ETNP18_MAG_17]|jgi:L-threonylcarbamoyladenylate synthase|nr:L-threonylcarbamoyladenylate synthase [Prochlorococcaceae cyanobacterium ETNP18_MAG_17]MDP6321609.1 L-threonylcarbamoyladenylate synthase [Prochlorococcaceae cyanobacterium ETNP14_MAG_5]
MELLPTAVLEESVLASRLKAGSAALFPTDTLPALAASPDHAAQLWTIKRRSADKPLILMGASPQELLEEISPLAFEDAKLMAKRYWPGALTLVVPFSGIVAQALNPGAFTLGIRVPDCVLTRSLLKQSGPLATTSANLSGDDPSFSAEDAAACFPGLPLLGPLPWPTPSGLASTVLTWQGVGRWHLLRRGSVVPEL